MSKQVDQNTLIAGLEPLLVETFEQVHGIYLDRGTSLFETLATITSAEASVPVGGACASLAAQVAHINFYLEVMQRFLSGQVDDNVDWDVIWNTISGVSPAEWDTLQARLKETYQQTLELVRTYEHWDRENAIGGAFAIVVHTAYHLGEIRQALCWVK